MQKGGFALLKRFLCALIVAALLLFCVACGSHAAVSADSIATAAPTASSSRNIRSEPITVNSTVADADTVNNADRTSPLRSNRSSCGKRGQRGQDAPATGDFPVPYLVAVLGLILVCSAGLVMLKRI